MAEFDPTPPKDAAETAYAQALLDDEAGREQRRARLMAALPRPEPVAAMPVARTELAWRWQPYAWGLAATGLLLATVLVLKGRPVEPGPKIDPRLAAGPTASAPVVVAQAEPSPAERRDAPAAAAPPVAVRIVPTQPMAVEVPAVVVAQASLPQQRREKEVAVTAAVEAAREALEPPPAAPVMAAAPVTQPAAPMMAAAPAPPPAPVMAPKPVAPQAMSEQTEVLARADAAAGLARSRMAPAASDAAAAKLMAPAESMLPAAVNQADPAAVRSALQAGASVHQRDSQGRTVLMLAARSGSREVVELLLAAGARKADRDSQGWTAADHAREQGHEDLAERLR